MKENVIFVNSLFNIITAVQLRTRVLKEQNCDVVLSSLSPGLEEVYRRGVLKRIFDDVYFSDYRKLSRLDRLNSINSPKKVVRKLLGRDLPEYSDIFFWNPTTLLHQYLRQYPGVRKHVYGDALGSYVIDHPYEESSAPRGFVGRMIAALSRYQPIAELDYDYYVFRPEFVSCETSRKLVAIPGIDRNDQEAVAMYLDIFNLRDVPHIQEKYIFMDVKHGDQFPSEAEGLKNLQAVRALLSADDLIVKPHPRQNQDVYRENGIRIFDCGIPWEAYFFKADGEEMARKTIIAYHTSSLFMPYLLFDINYRSVYIDLPTTFSTLFHREYSLFIDKMIRAGYDIRVIQSISDLNETILQ